ncbi:MAG: YceD family protein [Endomicrobium sp.]|jgi:uncharacterized protein|nr:YceD family protein [Endomicrobium sp.]
MKRLIFNTSDFIKSDAVERRVEKFEGDIGYSSNIAVNLKVIKISDDKVYVSGAVEGYIEMECARCLSIYRHPVELYIETDMDFLNGEVDMAEEIRQRLILEIPSKPLCDQDCLGICPECGKHNKEKDRCSCQSRQSEDFSRYRWESLFGKNKK